MKTTVIILIKFKGNGSRYSQKDGQEYKQEDGRGQGQGRQGDGPSQGRGQGRGRGKGKGTPFQFEHDGEVSSAEAVWATNMLRAQAHIESRLGRNYY